LYKDIKPKECKKYQSKQIVKSGFKELVDRKAQRYKC